MATVENIEGSMLVLWVDGTARIAPLRQDRLRMLLRMLHLFQHEDPENKLPVLCQLAPAQEKQASRMAESIMANFQKQGA